MSVRARPRRPSFADTPTAPIPLYLPVSFLVLGLVVFVALTILMIGARSPYTHGNLAAGYDSRYERTQQILIGGDTSFSGLNTSGAVSGDTAIARGEALYVSEGCATCHALQGRGGPVAPPIAGTKLATLQQRVRQGPAGMPSFTADGLTDTQLVDIEAYLRSVVQK
jgi:cytochrome c553